MSTVLNRNFDDEVNYKNVSVQIDDMRKNNICADYVMISDDVLQARNKQKSTVYLSDNGLDSNGKPLLSGANKFKAAAHGSACLTQLHIILNRNNENNIGDYMKSGCDDSNLMTAPPTEVRTNLAQTDMARLLRDKQKSQYMRAQKKIDPL
jgi:hypothetical protein